MGQPQVTETPLAVLPATVDCLEETFQVLESEPGSLEWEFMWNALIEEGRDRKLKSKSITLGSEDSALLVETMSDEDTLAEAAIKVGYLSVVMRSSKLFRWPWAHLLNPTIPRMRQIFSRAGAGKRLTKESRACCCGESCLNVNGILLSQGPADSLKSRKGEDWAICDKQF